MSKKANPYYISNIEFYQEIKEYLERRQEAIDTDQPIPQIPDCISKKFIKLANKLSNKPNFRGYSYKDEMILDGIEAAVRKIHKFDPEKYDNPFAYFTTIISNEFVQRIKKENKELMRKKRYLQSRVGVFEDAFDTQEFDEGSDYGLTDYMEELKDMYYQDEKTSESISEEGVKDKSSTKTEPSPIDAFVGD